LFEEASLICLPVSPLSPIGQILPCIDMSTSEVEALPPIRFISFEPMKHLQSFPRYPENSHLCIDMDSIDRSDSLVIFVSHCWLRGWSGAQDWDGRPHPDNAANEKFKLCVEGIEKIKLVLAPGAKKCYLWLDFACIDQNGHPAGELKSLDQIIRNCDVLFTPIHSENIFENGHGSFYQDYVASAWNEGPYSYTQRGCKVTFVMYNISLM
jgi:hypothetical protein